MEDNRVYIRRPVGHERTRLRFFMAGVAVLCMGIAAMQIRLTFASNAIEAAKDDVLNVKDYVTENAAQLAPEEDTISRVEDALADVNAAIAAQQALDDVVTDVNAVISADAPAEAQPETPTTP